MKVYWTNVEFQSKEKSTDLNKIDGGFVYGFVNCTDAETAKGLFTKELETLNYGDLNFDFVKDYDVSTEWDNQEDTDKYKELHDKALKVDKPIFDEFFLYDNV